MGISLTEVSMTTAKYLLSTGVCTTAEMLALKREDPAGYEKIIQWTREQAKNLGIELELPTK